MDSTLTEQDISMFSSSKIANFCRNLENLGLQDWNNHGYNDGSANAEIRTLKEEIAKKEAQLNQLENKHESHNDRMQLVDEFLKNAAEEQKSTEILCKASERGAEAAKHLTAVTKRKEEGYSLDNTKNANEIRSLAEKRNVLEDRNDRNYQRIEKFRKLMNKNQKTMDGTLEESGRKHADTMAIMKYSQHDEQRIKSITLETERKNVEVTQKRKAHDREMTETLSAQLVLEKSTQFLQQTHLETELLLHQWEKTIKHLAQRDAEAHHCLQCCAEAKDRWMEKNATLTEMKRKDNTLRNRMDTENNISAARQQSLRLQRELKKWENDCTVLQDELANIKGERDKSSACVKSEMSNWSIKNKMIQERYNKLMEAKVLNTSLEEKLKEVIQIALSEEEKVSRMDLYLSNLEKENAKLDFQLRESQEELFRQKSILHGLKTKEKDTMAVISMCQTPKNQKKELKKQERIFTKQKIVLTEQDAKLITLERKLAWMQGDLKLDTTKALQATIDELTAVVEEKKSFSKLANLLKESECDIRKLNKELENYDAQTKNVTSKLEELSLYCKNIKKELKAAELRRQEDMVDNNILKVVVTRIRDLVYGKTESVLSLEKKKLGLQKTLKEREGEISVYTEMLTKKLKICEKDRQKLSIEFNEKVALIKRLGDHFEVQMVSLAAPDEDVVKWQAHCITKAALEKEEHKRKGDELAATICKVQLENKALENTNSLFTSNVSMFQESLKRNIESGPEYNEKLKLEKELNAIEDHFKMRKKCSGEFQKELEKLQDTVDCLLEDEQVYKDELRDQRQLLNSQQKEISSQLEKMMRAKKQDSKLIKEIRSMQNTSSETLEEMEIKLNELKDLVKRFDHMLSETVIKKPDVRAVLAQYSQDNQLFLAPSFSPTICRSSKTNSAHRVFRSTTSSASSTNGPLVTPKVQVVELQL